MIEALQEGRCDMTLHVLLFVTDVCTPSTYACNARFTPLRSLKKRDLLRVPAPRRTLAHSRPIPLSCPSRISVTSANNGLRTLPFMPLVAHSGAAVHQPQARPSPLPVLEAARVAVQGSPFRAQDVCASDDNHRSRT